MRHLIHSSLVALALSMPMLARAETNKLGTTITSVYVSTDQVLIRLATGQDGERCGDDRWAIIDRGALNGASLFKLALASRATGRAVEVRLAGCFGTYAQVQHIRLR